MLQFAVFAVLIATVCAVPINDESKTADLDVIVVHNIDDYLAENPEVRLLAPFSKEDVQDRAQIRYTLGNHVNGDRLVATNNHNQQWSTPQNVNAKLNYPSNGVGSVVSYVQILVEQSSSIGRAYVVDGGIGQRRITAIIEAGQTLYFRYNAQIYGYN